MNRRGENREKALKELQQLEVLMLDGHFDYGNGFHGRVYINPHALFVHPSTIWRFAQDLLDLLPTELLQTTEVVAGPATGGALLAHTLAGLLDSRRSLTHPPSTFAPLHNDPSTSLEASHSGLTLRRFYANAISGKRVLLADDVRNTGQTLAQCAELVKEAGGTVVATMQIYDRLESTFDLGVPNFALAEYKAPENFNAADCPLCEAKVPITRF
ncbi:MAG TPA: phosphoribosyltransferase family protein [Vicinamibacterales bacterium]|nr:phosphoribosyltransferase family protein [Vicinamibacterales bacterium]